MDPKVLIEAIRARGSDATDLRDAAHEAHHALATGMRGRWTRKQIDRAVQKKGRVWAVRDEALARAVEQIVCKEVGVKILPLDRMLFVSSMEAMKIDKLAVMPSQFKEIADKHIESGRAKEAADRVLALARSGS